MAKQQEFIDLFAKYDEDKDGQVTQQQFINIITELEVPYQYPGTVSKIIRKLNHANPDKETLSLEQAKQYYNSFESISKHEIWKARISLLNKAEEIKKQTEEPKEESGAAPGAAAPGAPTAIQQPQKSPQEARINILIGQAQPVYTSEIDIQIEKTVGSQKVKPFAKLTLTSKTEARAKQLETIFKENVSSFFATLSEQVPDYADLLKEIHINSMVVGTVTTFFITTTNQEVVQLIQLVGEFLELTFNIQLASRAHLKFEFDYDFEKFINEENSNFYDIFTRNCRLSLDVSLLNLMKSMRRLFKADLKQNPHLDQFEAIAIGSLLFIEGIEGDFEFENSEITEYQTESKQEIKELLKQWRELFNKLLQSGMKVQELLQHLDDTINIQFKGGEWKANLFFRLKNLNKIFLYDPVIGSSDDEEAPVNVNQVLIKSNSVDTLKNEKKGLPDANQGSESSQLSDSSMKKPKKVKQQPKPESSDQSDSSMKKPKKAKQQPKPADLSEDSD